MRQSGGILVCWTGSTNDVGPTRWIHLSFRATQRGGLIATQPRTTMFHTTGLPSVPVEAESILRTGISTTSNAQEAVMFRPIVARIIGVTALLGLVMACGSPTVTSPSSSNSSPQVATASSTPKASGSALDPAAQQVLDYVHNNVRILSGKPQLLLSRSVTVQDLANLNIGRWHFASGCNPGLQLVIVKGDFDMQGTIPAAIPAEKGIPVKYIAFTFDRDINEIIAMAGDPGGAQVKQALNDSSLPSASPGTLPVPEFGGNGGASVPCKPMAIPGGSEPTAAP